MGKPCILTRSGCRRVCDGSALGRPMPTKDDINDQPTVRPDTVRDEHVGDRDGGLIMFNAVMKLVVLNILMAKHCLQLSTAVGSL